MKILNFSPYTFINVHSEPEALVGESLLRSGNDFIQIRCNGLYSKNCVAMSAAGVWYTASKNEKQIVCKACKNRTKFIEKKFKFKTLYIDSFISVDDCKLADTFIENVRTTNWQQLSFDGLPVGRYASYEFLLNRKISDLDFNVELLEEYKASLWNVIVTVIAFNKIIENNKADRILVYNSLYSCNRTVCAIGDKHRISNYTLHAGSHHKYRLEELTVFKGYQEQFLTNSSKPWIQHSKLGLSNNKIKKVYEHINELLSGRSPWVYTIKSNKLSPDKLREFYKIPATSKVLLALMASGDERLASTLVDALPQYNSNVFSSQFDWIESLITWAKKNIDIFIIIRVHPREFPNKRENILSTQASQLKFLLQNLPVNVCVNWPEDNISLHDIIKITNLGLNATSTAGLELLMFGVPVVLHNSEGLFAYPREFNYISLSKIDYFNKINEAIKYGPSLDNIVNVFRWISFRSEIVSIDISDGYAINNNLLRTIYLRLKNKIIKHLNPNYVVTNFKYNLKLKNAKWLISAINENTTSHIESYVKSNSLTCNVNINNERVEIDKIAKKYFKKISMDYTLKL